MTGVSMDQSTKDRWDELKPDDMTHADFAKTLLETYEYADEPVKIDTDEITQEIIEKVSAQIELASFRGTKEAIQEAAQE